MSETDTETGQPADDEQLTEADSPTPAEPKTLAKPRTRIRRPRSADVEAKYRTVATLSGGGKSQRQIARETGMTVRAVSSVLKQVRNDPELRAIRDESKARCSEKALALVEKGLDKIGAAFDGVPTVIKHRDGSQEVVNVAPPLSHQASALRELAAIAGLTKPDGLDTAGGGSSGSKLPMTPEFFAEMIAALRKHHHGIGQPKEVAGERVE